MTQISKQSVRFGESLLRDLSEAKTRKNEFNLLDKSDESKTKPSFIDHLEAGIKGVNDSQKFADKKSTDLATGKEKNIHETMLATSQAELSFNLMVQIRNKAIEAYQEIMRMPV